MLPDFHGNRSPLADPHATGVISGLTLDASLDSLARLYYRTAVGIALGTRHILDALNATGYAIDHLHVTGGHTKNPLLMELYADTTGCTVATAGRGGRGAARHRDGRGDRRRPLPRPRRAAAAAMARAGAVTEPDPATARRPTIATTASSSRCTSSAARWSGSRCARETYDRGPTFI